MLFVSLHGRVHIGIHIANPPMKYSLGFVNLPIIWGIHPDCLANQIWYLAKYQAKPLNIIFVLCLGQIFKYCQ